MSEPSPELSPKASARVAGLLYLIIIVFAGFGEGVVRGGVLVSGDAATTAQNVRESLQFVRLGFAADLIAFLCDTGVAVLLYVLLRPVSKTLSLAAMSFRLLAHPAIASANLLNHFAVVLLLGGAGYLTAFSPEQLEAFALFSLELHRAGYLIGGAFFGVHCALLGYLLYRSERFPAVLGGLLTVAAVGYLFESFAYFVAPSLQTLATAVVVITASVAEVSLCLWLLVRGVREASPAGAPQRA